MFASLWFRVASVFTAAMSLAPAQTVEIIAHRGASFEAPENTVPSIKLAWEKNADASEIDIYYTRDQRIVASHDSNTKRVTGVDLEIHQATLAEVQALDAGAWKSAQWAGTQIPTLEEVLAALPAAKRLVIEIKCDAGVLPLLEKSLSESGKLGQIAFIAFDYDTIKAAKARWPNTPAYWLYGFSAAEKKRFGNPSTEKLIELARAANLDGLDVKNSGPVTPKFVNAVSAAGLKLIVYTVNGPAEARRLARLGIHGITTDRPDLIRQALERK